VVSYFNWFLFAFITSVSRVVCCYHLCCNFEPFCFFISSDNNYVTCVQMPVNGNLSVTVNYRTNVIKVCSSIYLSLQKLIASSWVFLYFYLHIMTYLLDLHTCHGIKLLCWSMMLSVCLSVTLGTVDTGKWYILQQKCLCKWLGSALLGTQLYNFQHFILTLSHPLKHPLFNHRRLIVVVVVAAAAAVLK